MAPFVFGLITFQVALAATALGMIATRRYLSWLGIGTVIFYVLWWLLLGYPPLIANEWSEYS